MLVRMACHERAQRVEWRRRAYSPVGTDCNAEIRRKRLIFRCLRHAADGPQNSDYGTRIRATMGQVLAMARGAEAERIEPAPPCAAIWGELGGADAQTAPVSGDQSDGHVVPFCVATFVVRLSQKGAESTPRLASSKGKRRAIIHLAVELSNQDDGISTTYPSMAMDLPPST
jgi:hypothetical protein